MAMTCKTCRREDVDEINALLAQDLSLWQIVAKKPGLNTSALNRHKKCIDGLFAEVREERRAGLLADVDELKAEIIEVKETFPENPQARVQLIARRKEAIELEAKLTGAFIDPKKNPADVEARVKAYEDALRRLNMPADEIPAAVEEYRAELAEVQTLRTVA